MFADPVGRVAGADRSERRSIQSTCAGQFMRSSFATAALAGIPASRPCDQQDSASCRELFEIMDLPADANRVANTRRLFDGWRPMLGHDTSPDQPAGSWKGSTFACRSTAYCSSRLT